MAAQPVNSKPSTWKATVARNSLNCGIDVSGSSKSTCTGSVSGISTTGRNRPPWVLLPTGAAVAKDSTNLTFYRYTIAIQEKLQPCKSFIQ
jgi:hypothetical protein